MACWPVVGEPQAVTSTGSKLFICVFHAMSQCCSQPVNLPSLNTALFSPVVKMLNATVFLKGLTQPLGRTMGLPATRICYWAWSWCFESAFPRIVRTRINCKVVWRLIQWHCVQNLCESWMWSREMRSGKCEELLSKAALVRSHGRDGGELG